MNTQTHLLSKGHTTMSQNFDIVPWRLSHFRQKACKQLLQRSCLQQTDCLFNPGRAATPRSRSTRTWSRATSGRARGCSSTSGSTTLAWPDPREEETHMTSTCSPDFVFNSGIHPASLSPHQFLGYMGHLKRVDPKLCEYKVKK